MPWVRFTGDYPWSPVPQQTVMFKAGMVLHVPRGCAAAAIAAGKAVAAERPQRVQEAQGHGDQAR